MKVLDLSNKHIQTIEKTDITPDVELINLSHNEIQNLPKDIFENGRRIFEINLSSNQLENLSFLTHFSSLGILDLRYNYLEIDELLQIKHTYLAHLRICGNPFEKYISTEPLFVSSFFRHAWIIDGIFMSDHIRNSAKEYKASIDFGKTVMAARRDKSSLSMQTGPSQAANAFISGNSLHFTPSGNFFHPDAQFLQVYMKRPQIERLRQLYARYPPTITFSNFEEGYSLAIAICANQWMDEPMENIMRLMCRGYWGEISEKLQKLENWEQLLLLLKISDTISPKTQEEADLWNALKVCKYLTDGIPPYYGAIPRLLIMTYLTRRSDFSFPKWAQSQPSTAPNLKSKKNNNLPKPKRAPKSTNSQDSLEHPLESHQEAYQNSSQLKYDNEISNNQSEQNFDSLEDRNNLSKDLLCYIKFRKANGFYGTNIDTKTVHKEILDPIPFTARDIPSKGQTLAIRHPISDQWVNSEVITVKDGRVYSKIDDCISQLPINGIFWDGRGVWREAQVRGSNCSQGSVKHYNYGLSGDRPLNTFLTVSEARSANKQANRTLNSIGASETQKLRSLSTFNNSSIKLTTPTNLVARRDANINIALPSSPVKMTQQDDYFFRTGQQLLSNSKFIDRSVPQKQKFRGIADPIPERKKHLIKMASSRTPTQVVTGVVNITFGMDIGGGKKLRKFHVKVKNTNTGKVQYVWVNEDEVSEDDVQQLLNMYRQLIESKMTIIPG